MYILFLNFLQLLCIIVQEKDDVSAFKEYSADESRIGAPPTTTQLDKELPKQEAQTTQTPTQMPQEAPSQDKRLKASPFAKKLAGEQGIDLTVLFF